MSTFLIIHIIGGAIALLSGLLAIFAQKKRGLHSTGGLVYSVSMFVTAIAAIIVSVQKDLLFLLLVGLFSLYLVSSAWRSLYHFKARSPLNSALDYIIILSGWITAAYMLYLGSRSLLKSNFFGLVPTVFGLITLLLSIGYLKRLRKDSPKKEWLRGHISGMGGAYIATLTAFLVVNIQIQPAWVLWLLPTVIGSVLISRAVTKYIR
jgi:hypothetical protein